KKGDRYLRSLLVNGAMAVVQQAQIRPARGALRGYEAEVGYRLADRLLQTLHALAFLADALKKLFERHTLLAMLELLRHQPFHVRRPPCRLARIAAPQPEHQRGDLLAFALEVLLRSQTGAREIAHGFVPLVGHPDRSELARAQQLGEAHRIAPVRLDPLARFLGDK